MTSVVPLSANVRLYGLLCSSQSSRINKCFCIRFPSSSPGLRKSSAFPSKNLLLTDVESLPNNLFSQLCFCLCVISSSSSLIFSSLNVTRPPCTEKWKPKSFLLAYWCEDRRWKLYLNRTGALRSKGFEWTTKKCRPCSLCLFFRYDLCNLIREKIIHVVQSAL